MDLEPKRPAKRGRPPSASIPEKIIEGKNSNSTIKCPICYRKFPRNKSLQAHMRTHTGETPYKCDYPGCEDAFRQSGHLRSHLYTHSGEKPYRCPVEGCRERYTHSNRRCSVHKFLKLVRDGKEVIRSDLENLSEAQIHWLLIYKEKKFAKATKVYNPKTSSKVCNPKRKMSIESVQFDEESFDKESFPLKSSSPVPVNNYETSGYGSYSSSEPSSSPGYYGIPEEMNIDCDSFVPPPKRIYMGEIEIAALILMDLKNGAYRKNAHTEVWDKTTEFLNSLN